MGSIPLLGLAGGNWWALDLYQLLSFTQNLYVWRVSGTAGKTILALPLVKQQFLFFAGSNLSASPPLLDLWLKQSNPTSTFLEVRNHFPGKPYTVPNFSRALAGKGTYLTLVDGAVGFLLLGLPKNYFLSCCIFFPSLVLQRYLCPLCAQYFSTHFYHFIHLYYILCTWMDGKVL